MKYIHFPTLALHAALLVLARLLLVHYPDSFLFLGATLLFAHVIWAAMSRRQMAPAYLLGCALQAAAFGFGLIAVSRGSFGLGGGEFARFFYLIALAGAAVIEAAIGIVKHLNK